MRVTRERRTIKLDKNLSGSEAMKDADASALLRELVDETSVAPPNEIVVRVFQRLKSFGAAAIVAIAPLLEDDSKRPAIAIMIREIAKSGPAEQEAACESLISAFRDVRPAAQDFLLQTIKVIGC